MTTEPAKNTSRTKHPDILGCYEAPHFVRPVCLVRPVCPVLGRVRRKSVLYLQHVDLCFAPARFERPSMGSHCGEPGDPDRAALAEGGRARRARRCRSTRPPPASPPAQAEADPARLTVRSGGGTISAILPPGARLDSDAMVPASATRSRSHPGPGTPLPAFR
jgi:hypothetical protein